MIILDQSLYFVEQTSVYFYYIISIRDSRMSEWSLWSWWSL